MKICVFCSANEQIDPAFFTLTEELGKWAAENGHSIVYGGVNQGLMECVAKASKEAGGRTIGVVPMIVEKSGRISDYVDVEIPCDNLTDRKQLMMDQSDVFIALPGGIGTLDEMFTVAASATIGYHQKPVILYNMKGFWDSLIALLDDLRATIHVEIFSRGTSELLAAARALKSGKILGFLADQDAGPGGCFTEFLGRTASTPMGPAVFARKFDAPVLPAFILRQPNGKHKVVIGEIMHYEDHGDPDKDLEAFTVKMTKIVDKIIRENPTQWLWFQKRWNTTPDMATKRTKHHTVGDKRLRRKAAANEAAKKAAEAEKKEEQPAK